MCSLYKNEYNIFKPVEIIIRKGLRKKEEKRRDEIIQVMICTYMEMS
jgi:hypothetical protein